MSMKFEKVGLFGCRYAINQVIGWVNGHETQSQESLRIRDDVERRLKVVEEKLSEK